MHDAADTLARPRSERTRRIEAPDADLRYDPCLFAPDEADRLFDALRAEVAWEQHRVRIAGREHPCPRLSAWQGDPGAVYTYSGITLHPEPWTPAVLRVRAAVCDAAGARFDSVLANLYRDGRDSMGWHADDEPELGVRPLIASVSLGAPRRFVLRHKRRRDLAPVDIVLGHGSLLLMAGPTQHAWRHSLPKTSRPVGPRINLTFRRIADR